MKTPFDIIAGDELHGISRCLRGLFLGLEQVDIRRVDRAARVARVVFSSSF